jgi:hypothetical protein
MYGQPVRERRCGQKRPLIRRSCLTVFASFRVVAVDHGRDRPAREAAECSARNIWVVADMMLDNRQMAARLPWGGGVRSASDAP